MDNIKNFFNNSENSESLINIIMNICFISVFIGIFFFTYAIYIEGIIVKTQLEIISINLVNTIKPFLTKKNIKDLEKSLKAPDMSQEDEDIIIYNSQLKSSAIGILSILFIFMFSASYILARYYNHSFFPILGKNLLLLVFIALTEYTFLHTIPKKYITGDPNYIKYKILDNIQEKYELVP